MRFTEIASRLTGFSCPIFGVSWNPSEPDVDAARRVIAYLEDRRVLYEPSSVEVPSHCVQSVLQLREFLTDEIGRSSNSVELREHLRAMRAACRKFLTRVDGADREIIPFANSPGHWAGWVFNDALGQMRGVFGVHVAQVAAKYGLDVEAGLDSILPDQQDDTAN
jgi:hypothetical protein